MLDHRCRIIDQRSQAYGIPTRSIGKLDSIDLLLGAVGRIKETGNCQCVGRTTDRENKVIAPVSIYPLDNDVGRRHIRKEANDVSGTQ